MIRQRPPSGCAGEPRPSGTLAGECTPEEAKPASRRWVESLRARAVPGRNLVLVVGACALAASALCVPASAFGADAAAKTGSDTRARDDDVVDAIEASLGAALVTLPWGDGDGQVGLERPAEGLTRGPEALAVAPDGRIAVLDSVNKRVVLLDAEGESTGALATPLAEPRFLAVDDDLLYVLDCDADRQLLTLDWDGLTMDTVALPELSDVVTGLFATEEGPCVEVAHESVFLVDGTEEAATVDDQVEEPSDTQVAAARPVGSERASLRPLAGRPLHSDLSHLVKVTFRPGDGVKVRSFRMDRQSLLPSQTKSFSPALASGRTLEHLVSVDGDGQGGLIVGARILDTADSRGSKDSLILTRMTSSGARHDDGGADTLLLSASSLAYLGQPYVVAPDGRVFQPVATEDGYRVLVHTFAGADTPDETEEVEP
jgi:hypothetical protein